VATNKKLRAKDVPRKNKNGEKPKNADDGEDDDDNDDKDDISNEPISGRRPKTFEGGNVVGFSTFCQLSSYRKLKRARVTARRIGKSFFLSCRPHRKLRHFMRPPVCRFASICLRSISSRLVIVQKSRVERVAA